MKEQQTPRRAKGHVWTDTGYGTLSLVLDRPGMYEVSLEAQGVCPNEYFLSKVAVEAKCNAEPAIDVEVFEVFHSYLTTCFPEVHFNGVASSDADGDSLTFWWSIIGVPERSRGVARPTQRRGRHRLRPHHL